MELKFESETLERYIVSYLLKDKSFFLRTAQYLQTKDYSKKSFFIDSKLQWLLNTSMVYYNQYEKLPSFDVMKIFIEKKFDSDPLLQKAMRTCAEEVYTKDLAGIEPDYIKEETIKFIRTERAVEATLQNEIDITNGNFDNLSDRMQKAININLDKDFGISLSNTSETLSLIQEVEKDSGLTFGSNALNSVLGTPKPGEITVFCGTPGIGKTIWLGNVATENMKMGKKIVFFSLEVDKKRLAGRLYRSLLLKNGIDLMNIKKEEVDSIFSEFKGGDIRIKNYPANSASANDFDAYLNDLYTIEGFKPDLIIVDYILITATNSKRGDSENSYKYYKTVSEELRNLCIKWECPMITAAQINRNGMSENGSGTKAIVTAKDLSESKGIMDTVDIMLIINQTAQEKALGEQDHISEQRLLVGKNRNGNSDEILPFTLDYNTMTIMDGKKRK